MPPGAASIRVADAAEAARPVDGAPPVDRSAGPPPGLPELVRPAYDGLALANLMPSVGAHLGVPGCTADAIGLPPAERYVVMLVDGLGWHLVRRSLAQAPYLADLLGDARALTSSVPSTTATSLASLGTGLPPGRHGLVGYSSRVPENGELLNALSWDAHVDPRTYQARPTFFERAVRAGVGVRSVGLERFAGSGLTTAALRGAEFVAVSDESASEARVELIAEAVGGTDTRLVYAYERRLDHAGHAQGWQSGSWRRQLAEIDEFCAMLRDRLPPEVALIITGDHGMVDIPAAHRVIVEDRPDLLAGVDAFAGEGRFRQLYVDRDDPAAVAARWAEALGERAWVRTRDEAIADGWFGPVDPHVLPRYGHVLVALRDDWAVMTRRQPRELSLVGMHGSLTAAEMMVPLFCD